MEIKLPFVQRVSPELFSDKIVGVQPMPQPSGFAHYLKFQYVPEMNEFQRIAELENL